MKQPLAHGLGVSLLLMNSALAEPRATIDYDGVAPPGLVGNGASIVRVTPGGYEFLEGGNSVGRFRLVIDGTSHELERDGAHSSFFPGGVAYRLDLKGLAVEVTHGATADLPYVAVIRLRNAKTPVALEVESTGEPVVTPAVRTPFTLGQGEGALVVHAGTTRPQGDWETPRDRFEAPYRQGLVLETPDALVNRAVPFNRFLIDLGFNGRLHVCELFRWRDVWSRDLGTGLAPGAMVAGQFNAARATIEYDLRRHAAANPRGFKVTEDTSQGGSAEGTAWLTRAVWRYYLLTGDKDFLRRAAAVLRPWVEAWIDRDADDQGLLIDVTEWMDHSRFFLFPDGARVLYSNALFVDLMRTFARIEGTLGNSNETRRLEEVRTRFVRGINAALWNEAAGRYDNLSLWGVRDERSSSDGNVLAVLSGVAPANRIPRVLTRVRQTNWRSAGSVTITPPMTHVDARNDHNYKVWPWWNAVEARARFLHGDVEGGIRLLEGFSRTLADQHYPGLVEELVTPEGVTEGGHAFVTAAGAYLDAVFEGLLGIEILDAGSARIRVAPNTPTEWKDWSASVPLPQGSLELQQRDGKLRIGVTDSRVEVIEAPAGAMVSGARQAPLSPRGAPSIDLEPAPMPLDAPPLRERTAVTFVEHGIPTTSFEGLPSAHVGAEELLTLDAGKVGALVVAGNALPRWTKSGADLQPALGRFLDSGGAIVFYGATMHDRQRMGEHGGVIDWYAYRPRIDYSPIASSWKFRLSPDGGEVEQANEHGLRNGWQTPGVSDAEWTTLEVPKTWQDHPPAQWQGWEWFRTRVPLPAHAAGKPVTFTLGRVNHRDWTYINGVLVGSQNGEHEFRSYRVSPGDAAYGTLKFGADNLIAVQVFYQNEAGGLHADTPTIGIEQAERAWTALDARSGASRQHPERHGVVSWGPGNFFNSWETSHGAFGFRIDGQGVEFTGVLAGLPDLSTSTHEAFTDFAISKPWMFQPLAYTRTKRKLLIPDHGEKYPVVARIVNTKTRGEFILIPDSVARSSAGPAVVERLLLRAAGVASHRQSAQRMKHSMPRPRLNAGNTQ